MNYQEFVDSVLAGVKRDSKTKSFEEAAEALFSQGLSGPALFRNLAQEALVRVDIDTPQWDKTSAKILATQLYSNAAQYRGYEVADKYGDFYALLTTLTDKGLYGKHLLQKYTPEDIASIGSMIDPTKDLEFTYVGLMMLADRYLAKDHDGQIWELPQERFMVIAMNVMQDEKENRLEHVKEAYWVLSNLYATVATPTLSNSGKPNGQLSSCFIDTVEDSLDGIYLDNWDNARISKNGGGIGVYMGKVRGRNSSIQGFKNKASGTIPWVRNLNNTANSVDQLGVRSGAIAVYQELSHWDILDFLQIGTNNGDERLKAREIWPGVCVPDYFMELIDSDSDGRMLTPDAPWHMFDPHEVQQVMGWSLEDSYDEERGSGTWRERYKACVEHPVLRRKTVPVKEIVKALVVAQLETGAPYMFYRDEVNRMNPNKHAGMIYCSNLCSEIAQNMSPSAMLSEEVVVKADGSKVIVYERAIGDLVVCNLASINLGRVVKLGLLRRVTRILMRMLDNVIDVNNLPLLQATETNKKYRPVGLGTFGWHHALAVHQIDWDSQESIDFADRIYEDIAYYAIEASVDLAEEKGSYTVFEGSDYHTGQYFELRDYKSEAWLDLKDRASRGVRNGYWGAVAPNASTGLIAGSTQGIDGFYGSQCLYWEEKKDFKVPVLAPDLSPETYYYYYRKNPHHTDGKVSILQNAKRQRHIDQAVSFNLYVDSHIKAKDLMEMHREAWRNRFKTTYYVRGTANEVDDCESCQ